MSFYKHGCANLSEYKIWATMVQRCRNPKCASFRVYGARGITICDEWATSFLEFYRYIGPRPTPEHTVDRIDTLRGYYPGNVRWATPEVQYNNKITNRVVEAFGKSQTVAQWSREIGINTRTIQARLNKGVPGEQAVSVPPMDKQTIGRRMAARNAVSRLTASLERSHV